MDGGFSSAMKEGGDYESSDDYISDSSTISANAYDTWHLSEYGRMPDEDQSVSSVSDWCETEDVDELSYLYRRGDFLMRESRPVEATRAFESYLHSEIQEGCIYTARSNKIVLDEDTRCRFDFAEKMSLNGYTATIFLDLAECTMCSYEIEKSVAMSSDWPNEADVYQHIQKASERHTECVVVKDEMDRLERKRPFTIGELMLQQELESDTPCRAILNHRNSVKRVELQTV